MKKVIITRDGKNGEWPEKVIIWENDAKFSPCNNDNWTSWVDNNFGYDLACIDIRDFKRLFGFTPRLRSKKTYEISIKEVKK